MTTYFLEQSACFALRETEYTTESDTCSAWAGVDEQQLLAPWTDGTWWIDVDGVTQVGWLELDGTPFPPYAAYPEPFPP